MECTISDCMLSGKCNHRDDAEHCALVRDKNASPESFDFGIDSKKWASYALAIMYNDGGLHV